MPSGQLQPGELLTVPETAALLRLRPSTIRAWLGKRKIPFVKLGRRVVIRRSDIEAIVERSLLPAREQRNGSP